MRGFGFGQACPVGEDDRLDSVSRRELVEDMADVGLDGVLADDELAGDLGVREALRHQRENLELSRSEGADQMAS